MTSDRSQSDKFKEAAHALGCDEDEARWGERLRKIATQKPAEKPKTWLETAGPTAGALNSWYWSPDSLYSEYLSKNVQ